MSKLVELNEQLMDYFDVDSNNTRFNCTVDVTQLGDEESVTGYISPDLFDLLKAIRTELDELEDNLDE